MLDKYFLIGDSKLEKVTAGRLLNLMLKDLANASPELNASFLFKGNKYEKIIDTIEKQILIEHWDAKIAGAQGPLQKYFNAEAIVNGLIESLEMVPDEAMGDFIAELERELVEREKTIKPDIVSRITVLFYKLSLKHIMKFHPEKELFSLLHAALQKTSYKKKDKLQLIISNIHANGTMSENEKINRYLLVLSQYESNHSGVKKIFQSLFHTDMTVHLHSYLLMISVDDHKTIFAINNELGEMVSQCLAASCPVLHKAVLNKCKGSSGLSEMGMAIHEILAVKKVLIFKLNRTLENEKNSELFFLREVEKFYLGLVNVESMRSCIKDQVSSKARFYF